MRCSYQFDGCIVLLQTAVSTSAQWCSQCLNSAGLESFGNGTCLVTWCIIMPEVSNCSYEFGQWQCWCSHCIQKIFSGYQGLLYVPGEHSPHHHTVPTSLYMLQKSGKSTLLAPNSDSSIYKNLDSSEYQLVLFDILMLGDALSWYLLTTKVASRCCGTFKTKFYNCCFPQWPSASQF